MKELRELEEQLALANVSSQLRRKIEEELILKQRLAKDNALLPASAIWHGKHKPYGAWNEEIHY